MRQYPDWITAYLEQMVPRSEAPERFHFWIAAATIAGALRRRVRLDMEAFSWYPNMFIVLVGPPGAVKKSTTMKIGRDLLEEVPNIHIGSDVATWEGFVQELEDAPDMFAEGDPTHFRFTFDDEHQDTRARTYFISEWGTFLDPNNHLMINMLTTLYDGLPFKKTTKTQGDNIIEKPFVNMIAGTTPDWMKDNFRGKFGGWGFSSRCIFLHCMSPERFIAYPDEEWRRQFKTAMEALLSDLIEISNLSGPITLTNEARVYGRTWYEAHMQRKADLDQHPHHDPWLSYYLARKFDHAHKLAICLCCSRDNNQLTITLGDLVAACARCDEVELELGNVFGQQPQTRAGKLNTDVWNGLENMIIKNNGGIPEHTAFRFAAHFMGYGATKDFINHMLASGLLRREVEQDQSWIVFGPEYHRQRQNGSQGA